MKQILQDLNKGGTLVAEAPAPSLKAGTVISETRCSLISAGTERMLVDFGRASYLEKARQQPEKVKMVLEKMATDGIAATVDAVRSKLGEPLPLGYSNVGVVTSVGSGIEDIRPGDRIVSNGPHADLVRVGRHLCARIPDAVTDEQAAFTVVASIGLQGIRLAVPTLGETFVVIGAGLIGLLTVQLLRAQGCRVLAVDLDDEKLTLARQFGAEICNPTVDDPVRAGLRASDGRGVDGVLITASSRSSDPVTQAARMCRQRGRIVLVGVTGLELNRADFYEKELSFQVSCSYGPGRYDSDYEEKGLDYPYGLVRWTEQRNFEAVLAMLAEGRLDVSPLISHRFPFEQAAEAYRTLTEARSALGLLLEYDPGTVGQRAVTTVSLTSSPSFPADLPVVGFIGAGNYASRVLIPAFREAGARFSSLVTSGGVNSVIHGKTSGFATASTDVERLLNDSATNVVVVATRHDSHAELVTRALSAGKHVFVEKPLALTIDQLADIESVWNAGLENGEPRQLMVGFNRRFAPHVQTMRRLLGEQGAPRTLVCTVNAGELPGGHWTRDPRVGGGRLVGEGCHFIDLMRHLAGAPIAGVTAQGGDGDNVVVTLKFENGSIGTLHYITNGHPRYPKERIDVFSNGRILSLDNFRKLHVFGWSGISGQKLWRQDKGQKACAAAFMRAVQQGGEAPIPVQELFEVSRATLEAARQVQLG
ncbi:bi-domain-containing oxidoreductase [Alloalcanivorax sp. C16-1]|uniref:bi-domain-containing oxidoreductase n=1 Tax=Alloalcanivorax sp. C16-1 TaxID=3390051 RepID=UPI0039706FC3